MGKQDYRGQDAQIETVATIELPALGDPLEREDLSLDEIRERCGYSRLTQCTICNHPKCEEMEKAVMVRSSRKVAQEYGVGRGALENHMRNHFEIPQKGEL